MQELAFKPCFKPCFKSCFKHQHLILNHLIRLIRERCTASHRTLAAVSRVSVGANEIRLSGKSNSGMPSGSQRHSQSSSSSQSATQRAERDAERLLRAEHRKLEASIEESRTDLLNPDKSTLQDKLSEADELCEQVNGECEQGVVRASCLEVSALVARVSTGRSTYLYSPPTSLVAVAGTREFRSNATIFKGLSEAGLQQAKR